MNRELIERIDAALTKAFNLGQTYWQQADSESYKQNSLSDVTRAKFLALKEDCKAALSQEAEPVASDIPCARCGGECVEFTVPNAIWNAVIRPDGKERDDEYLCIDCWYKALESHLSQPVASVPQDDEEFYRVYNRLFSRRGADTKHMAECEDVWTAAIATKKIASEPSELEMHRADYNAIKAAGFDSPGELLAAYKNLIKGNSHDRRTQQGA